MLLGWKTSTKLSGRSSRRHLSTSWPERVLSNVDGNRRQRGQDDLEYHTRGGQMRLGLSTLRTSGKADARGEQAQRHEIIRHTP